MTAATMVDERLCGIGIDTDSQGAVWTAGLSWATRLAPEGSIVSKEYESGPIDVVVGLEDEAFVATWSQGLHVLDASGTEVLSLPSGSGLQRLARASDGAVWLGASRGTLSRLGTQESSLETVATFDSIHAVAAGDSGTVWVAETDVETGESALHHIDPAGRVLQTRALPDEIAQPMMAVKRRDVWVVLYDQDPYLARIPLDGPPVRYSIPNLIVNGVVGAGGRSVWFTAQDSRRGWPLRRALEARWALPDRAPRIGRTNRVRHGLRRRSSRPVDLRRWVLGRFVRTDTGGVHARGVLNPSRSSRPVLRDRFPLGPLQQHRGTAAAPHRPHLDRRRELILDLLGVGDHEQLMEPVRQAPQHLHHQVLVLRIE